MWPTQDGDDLIVLNDLQWPWHNETESVDALSSVEDQVAGSAVDGLKLHGQRAKAAVTGQSERRMLIEHLSTQKDTHSDVCSLSCFFLVW